MTSASIHRRGIAIMYAVVVLATLGIVSGTAIWQILAGRRALERRANVLQADWLARSAVEVAAAKMASKPEGDASLDLRPGWTVKVHFEPDSTAENRFAAKTTATISGEDRWRVTREARWIVTFDKERATFTIARTMPGTRTDGE